MSAPHFLLQIVTPKGELVRFPAGGPLELALIDAAVTEIVSEGVGFLKTEAQVAAAIRTGLARAIYTLKEQTVKL